MVVCYYKDLSCPCTTLLYPEIVKEKETGFESFSYFILGIYFDGLFFRSSTVLGKLADGKVKVNSQN